MRPNDFLLAVVFLVIGWILSIATGVVFGLGLEWSIPVGIILSIFSFASFIIGITDCCDAYMTSKMYFTEDELYVSTVYEIRYSEKIGFKYFAVLADEANNEVILLCTSFQIPQNGKFLEQMRRGEDYHLLIVSPSLEEHNKAKEDYLKRHGPQNAHS
ncbi:MAG: hypothetical protein AAB885_01890 [Patescibacteria group bacterium]